jgi:hypothetical protein
VTCSPESPKLKLLFQGLSVILAAIGTLSAQTVPTWGGLRFGMTEAQVRLVLGTKMLKPDPGPENQPADQSSRDFVAGVIRESSIKGFDGKASLLFDKSSKKLSMVTLMLAPQKDISDQDKATAYSRLRDDLVKKYGPPVSVKDNTTIFRSGGQSIDVFAALWDGVPQLVHIVYEATNTDKGF